LLGQSKKNEIRKYLILRKEKRNTHDVLVGRLKLSDHLEDLGVDRRVIHNWISKQLGGVDLSRLGCGKAAGSCEHSNETSGSIKGVTFRD
jgi:hypothetical protein